MREIVIISGKGGTGKTTVTSCLSALVENVIVSDCDVDGTDLHLAIKGNVVKGEFFSGGHVARINSDLCSGCGTCLDLCQFSAITHTFSVKPLHCEGCGVCVDLCPEKAIEFPEAINGQIVTRKIFNGYMVSGHLKPGAENSGKMVSMVRSISASVARENRVDCIITDGPPGIGCPVIASVTGASQVVVVTEPSVAGFHDLSRVLTLTEHFKIPVALIVNRWNVNESMTSEIEAHVRERNGIVAGRIPYDSAFPDFQMKQDPQQAFLSSDVVHVFQQIWSNLG